MQSDTDEYEAEHKSKINSDRRKSKTLQEWMLIFALLTNFGGLVWGAATLSSSVTQLQLTQSRINSTIDKMGDKQNNQDLSIVTIQTQIQNYQAQILDLQQRLRNARIR